MRFKHPKVVQRKLGKNRADGIMEYDTNTIYVDERLKGKNRLDTYIHEYMHYIFPDMEEAAVADSASRIADFLWKHGFRHVDNIP